MKATQEVISQSRRTLIGLSVGADLEQLLSRVGGAARLGQDSGTKTVLYPEDTNKFSTRPENPNKEM